VLTRIDSDVVIVNILNGYYAHALQSWVDMTRHFDSGRDRESFLLFFVYWYVCQSCTHSCDVCFFVSLCAHKSYDHSKPPFDFSVHAVLVGVLDDASAAAAVAAGVHCVRLTPKPMASDTVERSEWHSVGHAKVSLLASLARAGVDVIFSEMDVVW
jgi:hypothetical protein